MSENGSELVDTRGAAKYLGVSIALIERWRWDGRGPMYIKFARACRYRKSDLEAFLVVRERRSTSDTGGV